MKQINKLVRDKVPSIIHSEGRRCTWLVLDEDTHHTFLLRKLVEEANEVKDYTSLENLIEELADVREVIECLMVSSSITEEDIVKVQLNKKREKGSFELGTFLVAKEEK